MAITVTSPNARYQLGYWGIRGLGQPIRFMLVHAGISFDEFRFGVNQDGSLMDRENENRDWDDYKVTLDTGFPNLPYLIDREAAVPLMTQSGVIMRYLADKHGYFGDSEDERIQIQVLQDEVYDFRNHIVRTCYTLGEEYKGAFLKFREIAMPRYLDGFERHLESRDSACMVGSRLSLVDFCLYEQVWQTMQLIPGTVSDTSRPNLNQFVKKFEAQEAIAGYMTSENYIDRPINSPWASFC